MRTIVRVMRAYSAHVVMKTARMTLPTFGPKKPRSATRKTRLGKARKKSTIPVEMSCSRPRVSAIAAPTPMPKTAERTPLVIDAERLA